jgi:phage repressor protein C with HTH and peptisase S24 domain
MNKTFVDQIRDVICMAVLKYGTVYRVAQVTGINKVNIGRWIKGTPPRSEDVSPIIELMGARLVMPDEPLLDYDMVPKVAAKAGAGSSMETSGETLGMYAFRKAFLAREGIHASSSIMLDVVGDSMEPLIRAGDTILVDTSDRNVQDGKTYLVAYGDDLKVKHVFKSPQGLILRSENQRYADVTIAPDELGTYAVIHGRVRWFGRLL